jgi:ferredoxin-NADP reductase
MAGTTISRRLNWRLGEVLDTIVETPQTKSLMLTVPGWPGQLPGQHVDVRLTAADGYQAERSYSIASAPGGERIEITVERLDNGEVSPYLTEVLRPGDRLEVRGPIGGYFTWVVADGGPLLLVGGGSGVVPLMAMIRYRAEMGSTIPTRLLLSSRTFDDIIYREELARKRAADATLEVRHTLTRAQPPGWQGYGRRIDAQMLSEVAWPPDQRPGCYVCGPTPLVESVASALVELGHQPERVKTERFGPTGG